MPREGTFVFLSQLLHRPVRAADGRQLAKLVDFLADSSEPAYPRVTALRVRGLFLAVATLAFAVAAQTWFYGQSWLVKVVGGTTSLEIPRFRALGIDFQSELHYYWLCLLVLVVLALGVHRLRSTGIGRSMMAVRDNEPAAATLGISPRRVKLIAFVLAGMIAAVAGWFYGGLLVGFGDPTTFAPDLSIALMATAIVGGVTTVTGAVLGAVFLRGLAYFVAPHLSGAGPCLLADVPEPVGLSRLSGRPVGEDLLLSAYVHEP